MNNELSAGEWDRAGSRLRKSAVIHTNSPRGYTTAYHTESSLIRGSERRTASGRNVVSGEKARFQRRGRKSWRITQLEHFLSPPSISSSLTPRSCRRLFFLFPSVSLSPFSDERWSNSFPFKVMDTEILPELSAWVQRTAKSLFRRLVVHLPALHAPSASPGLIGVVAPEERAGELAEGCADPFTPLEFTGAAIVSTFALRLYHRSVTRPWLSVTPCPPS